MKLIIDIPKEEYKVIRRFQDIAPNKTHPLAMSIINGTPLDDIETLKHRSYLEGFHKAYQMYYKMFDDIKVELTEWHNIKHSGLSDANYQIMLDIIGKHIGERSEDAT